MEVIDIRSIRNTKGPHHNGRYAPAAGKERRGKVIPLRNYSPVEALPRDTFVHLMLVSVLYMGSLGMGVCLLVKAVECVFTGAGAFYGSENLFGAAFPLLK